MVDRYVFQKCLVYALFVSKCLYMILTCFSGLVMLNLWLDSEFIDHMGPKSHLPS
jgi:hypothetical protein